MSFDRYLDIFIDDQTDRINDLCDAIYDDQNNQNIYPVYWKCTKKTKVMGYFSTLQKAREFKKEESKYSMDNSSKIRIEIVYNIPKEWKYEINETVWGKW